LPLKEYGDFKKSAVLEYYLKGKEAEEIAKIIFYIN